MSEQEKAGDASPPRALRHLDAHVRHHRDIGFTVLAKVCEARVEYTIYDIEGETVEGEILYHKAGATSSPDPVATIEESEPYLHGDVKWDGCSNWYFDEQDRVMLHGCSRGDVARFGEVMARCWDWTKELLKNFDA